MTTSSMTSRERVLATLAGRPVDRIACDFRAEPEVYDALRARLGLPDDEAVRRWARSDFRDLGVLCSTGGYGGYGNFGWRDEVLPDGSQRDFWGVRRLRVGYGAGSYIDIVEYPLKHCAGIDELRRYEFPSPARIFDFSSLPEAIRRAQAGAGGPYFLLMEGESLHDRCWALRGIEEFLMDMAADEDAAEFLIEGNYRFFTEYTRLLLEQADGALDCIGIYNDLGCQLGLLSAPSNYRKYFKTRQAEYIRMVKSYGVKVFYHSCGGITDLLDDLIEIGADILDPLQFNAMRLTPEQLIERVGDRITLHGGVSVQDFLVRATPDEVRAHVRDLTRTLSRHGRYILSGSHLLQVDVPAANIEALCFPFRD